MKHTATPWEIDKYENVKPIGDGYQDTIRTTGFALSSGKEAKANAAFIVRACNAHDDLVKALRAMFLASDPTIPGLPESPIELARAALAKATHE